MWLYCHYCSTIKDFLLAKIFAKVLVFLRAIFTVTEIYFLFKEWGDAGFLNLFNVKKKKIIVILNLISREL